MKYFYNSATTTKKFKNWQKNSSQTRNKTYPDWKGRGKTVFICKWHDTIHRKFYKNSKQKLLELTNEFNKVAGYHINLQKSVAFIYTTNEVSERESFLKNPF